MYTAKTEDLSKEQLAKIINIQTEQIKKLEHHKHCTVGLWATDRPDLLSEEERKKCFLFEIKE